MTSPKTIHYASGIPTNFTQLLDLYRALDWTSYTEAPEKLSEALENSSYVICAYDTDRIVGTVRGLSDRVAIHFIQDLLVHPNYQSQGIGRTLLRKAIALYPESRKHVLMTYDDPLVKAFYTHQEFQNTREIKPRINVFMKKRAKK